MAAQYFGAGIFTYTPRMGGIPLLHASIGQTMHQRQKYVSGFMDLFLALASPIRLVWADLSYLRASIGQTY